MTKAAATSGSAEGTTPRKDFGNALLAAGIGNINHVKVPSIDPAEATVDLPRLQPGASVPPVYAAMTSEVPGEVIGAAVAGPAGPPAKNGVIMEFYAKATRDAAKRAIVYMLEEAFRARGWAFPRDEGLRHRSSHRTRGLRSGGHGAAFRRRRRLVPDSCQPALCRLPSALHGRPIVLCILPFEGMVNLRTGADHGPRDLRRATDSVETYSPFLGCDLEELGIADLGHLEVGSGIPREQLPGPGRRSRASGVPASCRSSWVTTARRHCP